MKIDREAIQFFFLFLFIGMMIIIFAVELMILSYVFFFLCFFTLFFFRDPNREPSCRKGEILSPADGRVIDIVNIKRRKENCIMVSIFMSVFNVHINRIPIEGIIKSIRYNPGKFLPAFKEKASVQNEQTEIVLLYGEHEIVIKQIAGLIARRIVVRIKEGETVEKAQKFGLIRFGSRVDIILPEQTHINVSRGDKVKGGLSSIGVLK